MTTLRLRTLALGALCAVLAAACGGGAGTSSGDATPPAAGPTDQAAADAAAPTAAPGTDAPGTDAPGTDAAATGEPTAAATGEEVADGEPIVVGTLLSVTGPIANLGDKMRRGIELAIEQLNAAGGIDGRPIEQVFYDPAGDTATAVDQTRRLIEQDGVDVIVGGGSASGIALAMAPLTEEAGLLFMATEGARQIVEPASEHPLTFKATFNDTAIVERTLAFWEGQGIERVAFLPDTSGFGQSAQEVMAERAGEAGIEVAIEPFDPAATDLTPQLSNLSGAAPQAYLAWTTTAAGVVFMNNAAQLGLGEDALIQHSFGFVDERFFEQAGDAGVGVVLTSPALPVADQLPAGDPQAEAVAAFVEAYQERFDEFPNVFAGQTFDGMMLVAEAIRQAGTTEGAALAEALESITGYVGVTGEYNLSPEDHSGLSSEQAQIIEWTGERFELFGGGG